MRESEAVAALRQILELTGEWDWYLIHRVVRDDVASGALSKADEAAYKKIVDKIAKARGKTYIDDQWGIA